MDLGQLQWHRLNVVPKSLQEARRGRAGKYSCLTLQLFEVVEIRTDGWESATSKSASELNAPNFTKVISDA
jgi:hypothetical protein